MRQPELSIVFPAYNEAENIGQSIEAALELPIECEIIVVDDGSADKTADIVRCYAQDNQSIRLIEHSENQGYGAALRSGFEAAQGEYIFFTDSDLQFELSELMSLWHFRSSAEIVSGFRKNRQDPGHRRLNAWAWGHLVRSLTGIRVKDINCAFKLFQGNALKSLNFKAKGAFINTEILAKAMASDYRIIELPVTHFPRVAGQQTGAHPTVVLRAFWELFTVHRSINRI